MAWFCPAEYAPDCWNVRTGPAGEAALEVTHEYSEELLTLAVLCPSTSTRSPWIILCYRVVQVLEILSLNFSDDITPLNQPF